MKRQDAQALQESLPCYEQRLQNLTSEMDATAAEHDKIATKAALPNLQVEQLGQRLKELDQEVRFLADRQSAYTAAYQRQMDGKRCLGLQLAWQWYHERRNAVPAPWERDFAPRYRDAHRVLLEVRQRLLALDLEETAGDAALEIRKTYEPTLEEALARLKRT